MSVDVEPEHHARAAAAAPMPRPEPEWRSMVKPKNAVLQIYSCTMWAHEVIPIRQFSVGDVEPYAQYERAVLIDFTEPRKRNGARYAVVPTNFKYVTIEVAAKVVYDSRADIPVDMDWFNAERTAYDARCAEVEAHRAKALATITQKDTTEMVMTKTDLATQDEPIEGEVVEPLTEKAAKALDKKIRATSDKVTTNVNLLIELLDQAERGQIHEALAYPSWTAWVKDAVQISIPDPEERKALVSLMSGKGMSTRAIAGSLRISKSQAARDAAAPSGAPEDELARARASKGLDGKNYSRIPPKKKAKPVEPEPEPLEVEEVDDPLEPPRQREVTSSIVPARRVVIPVGYHPIGVESEVVDTPEIAEILTVDLDPGDGDGPVIEITIPYKTAWQFADLINEYRAENNYDDDDYGDN
jgi:hypothetical protein